MGGPLTIANGVVAAAIDPASCQLRSIGGVPSATTTLPAVKLHRGDDWAVEMDGHRLLGSALPLSRSRSSALGRSRHWPAAWSW